MALRDLFASPPVAACFTDAALIDSMLAFERALARAEAACSVIPASAAQAIDAVTAQVTFDANDLVKEARNAGTLVIPFVKRLTHQVAATDAEAARYVHWGSTSQDVVDTAMVLQGRTASGLVTARLEALGDALARLVETHRTTPTIARTLLQPAAPVPFGWKAAVWLDAVTRCHRGMERASREFAVVQFGGASGVVSALRADGARVAEALARELDLALPPTPWHGVRDNVARLAAELGIVCEVAGKIGGDVALLAQAEVAEAFEPAGAGRGGSSALPHKRNPVGAMFAREAALRAPGLVATLLAGVAGEHERGLGHWQTQFWTLGDLFGAAGSALDAMVEVIEGLVVDPSAMRRNLDATRGFVYAEALAVALGGKLGKEVSHRRVEALCRQALRDGLTLEQALSGDSELSRLISDDARSRVFDPASQFGAADSMIDAALNAWRERRS
jgi:3-carboxy-cis,cis-muconate cycloisomerase